MQLGAVGCCDGEEADTMGLGKSTWGLLSVSSNPKENKK